MEENRADSRLSGTQRKPRAKKRKKGTAKLVLVTLLAVGLTTCLMFFGIFMVYVNTTLEPLLDVDISAFTLKQSSTVYYQDKSSGEWVELTKLHGAENRTLIDYEDLPDHVWQALVAIEDERFFEHHGVDWKSTARAIFDKVTGRSTRGGSTITQQVVKNTTGDKDVTIKRKVTEIFRALRLAKNYSREEILETYLNLVYFGNGCYGIEAAAETYFGKTVSELTVAEAADIVGITQNPYKYDPSRSDWCREQNKDRQLTVLYKMNELGYLSDEEYEQAKSEPLVYTWDEEYAGGSGAAESAAETVYDSYFVERMFNDIVGDMCETYGYDERVAKDMLYTGGYSIYCTVDPEIQEIVESVYADRNNLNYTSAKGEQLQSGATIIDNATGNIVAVAGRVGEREGRFLLDYSTVVRQCGSAIKPLSVYAPALDAGVITPASVIDDYPVQMMSGSVWPVNAYKGYKGVITLQDAVRNSSNPTAVRVVQQLTLSASYTFMTENLGFTTLENDDLTAAGALALGGLSKGVTTREMAAAYASFANNGIYTVPRTYVEVKDSNGSTILENKSESHVAMKESTAESILALLKEVVSSGTGTGAKFSGMTIAGKTGSTNSNNDRYFVGLTPYYTAAVWVGYNTPTRIVASGNPAATLWKTFMSKIHEDLPNKDFSTGNAEMESVTVCTQTGLLASASCPSHTVKVAKGSAPTLTCDAHITVALCGETGLLAGDYCPNVTTAAVLDLSQPNVSEGWGYTRELLSTPLSASEQATYAAQLEEGLISSIPTGTAVQTNEGSVRLYSDVLSAGACTAHTVPSHDPVTPDDDDAEPSDGEDSEDGGETDDTGGNGSFLDWLLDNGGTTEKTESGGETAP
jgi:penicillin-binding protein 1A